MSTDEERSTDFRERIVVDPKILVGKPVVKGTRIPVSMILNLVAHGLTFDQIIDDYPVLTDEDIRAAILYAGARLDREEVLALSVQP
jgi:uncharacterized protein (DUF433 family)